ncbi:MAG: DUF3137 domain-containing protein [Capsulimonadaceae bacterium]
MDFLKTPNVEAWQRFSAATGAEYTAGDLVSSDRVDAQMGPWTMTLDKAAYGGVIYTRMRIPYVNPSGFRFQLAKAGQFAGVENITGCAENQLDDPEFDRLFTPISNNEEALRLLLSDNRLRARIWRMPSLHLAVLPDEGWFGEIFPENVDELRYLGAGLITDAVGLRDLFDLLGVILERMCEIGAATRQEPEITL